MANELMWALEGLGREYTAALDPKGRFACKEPTRCIFDATTVRVLLFSTFFWKYRLFSLSLQANIHYLKNQLYEDCEMDMYDPIGISHVDRRGGADNIR